jgi:hypothetical protein
MTACVRVGRVERGQPGFSWLGLGLGGGLGGGWEKPR